MPGLIYNTLSYLNRKDIHVDVNFLKYKENVNFLSDIEKATLWRFLYILHYCQNSAKFTHFLFKAKIIIFMKFINLFNILLFPGKKRNAKSKMPLLSFRTMHSARSW